MPIQNLYDRNNLPATTALTLAVLEQSLPHDRYNIFRAPGYTEYRHKQNPGFFITIRHDTTPRGDVMLGVYGKGSIEHEDVAELIRKLREVGHDVERGQRMSDDASIFLVSGDKPIYIGNGRLR